MTHVWVLYSYDGGYPTNPLAVFGSPQAAFERLGGVWEEVPSGWDGRGGLTSFDRDGVALELVRYEVETEAE